MDPLESTRPPDDEVDDDETPVYLSPAERRHLQGVASRRVSDALDRIRPVLARLGL